ncbi:MAG TPA: DUF2282 domain-containing protein [Alphaproteobacteria bacterium]|nr:DUF2282 domain-containing protein [Alphaproteobacteria bacterium]
MNKVYSIAATSALLGALAVAAGAVAQTKDPDMSGKEKCYGVTKAGKNDCAAGAHSCAGQSTKDGDKSSFVAVPAGLCARLTGGSTMAGK